MRFKVFLSNTLDALTQAIQQYTNQQTNSAARSIGIEYYSDQNQYVASIGYEDGSPGVPLSFSSTRVGNIGDGEHALTSAINQIVGQNTDTKTICHELFAGDNGDLILMVMSAAAGEQTMSVGASLQTTTA